MIYGVLLTIGVIGIIASRFLYGSYDIALSGDNNNNLMGGLALFLDILGTVLVVCSVINSLQ